MPESFVYFTVKLEIRHFCGTFACIKGVSSYLTSLVLFIVAYSLFYTVELAFRLFFLKSDFNLFYQCVCYIFLTLGVRRFFFDFLIFASSKNVFFAAFFGESC